MSSLVRRFLVLVALMFWLGGFTFYSAVVVPVGQSVLLSHTEQGFITREVTNYLNLSGAAALTFFAWDIACSPDRLRSRRWIRWLTWTGMLLMLGALIWLHGHLDGLMNVDLHELTDRKAFRFGHRWYLWLSTFQWAFGVVFAGVTLLAWRAEDQSRAIEAAEEVLRA